jgi:hypothetical protein
VSHLLVAFIGQFDAVIGYHLVDFPVLVPFGLRMSDEDDEAWFDHGCCFSILLCSVCQVNDEVQTAGDSGHTRRYLWGASKCH